MTNWMRLAIAIRWHRCFCHSLLALTRKQLYFSRGVTPLRSILTPTKQICLSVPSAFIIGFVRSSTLSRSLYHAKFLPQKQNPHAQQTRWLKLFDSHCCYSLRQKLINSVASGYRILLLIVFSLLIF